MAVIFVSCGNKDENLKFGLGTYTYIDKATSADKSTNGQGIVISNVATVLLDKDERVVSCRIDVSENSVEYTSSGTALRYEGFKTKQEMGDSYNMKEYSSSGKEWYEQVYAFEKLIVGKTADEILALVTGENKGNDQVISAGCTIEIDQFVKAVVEAIETCRESTANSSDTLRLGVFTEHTAIDADGDKNGTSKLETYFVAHVIDKDGKVVQAISDCVETDFSFDKGGVALTNPTDDVKTKRELGFSYGMSAYGNDLNGDGKILEWFEQADAFDSESVGLTPAEISGLAKDDGYGVDSLQRAGCTIKINGLTAAAIKA